MKISLNKNGLMVVLSSPSGAGKTTLARGLVSSDNNFILSISATTRKKRQDEIDGKDYHFIDKETFYQMQKDGEFLEDAQVFGNYYGTPKKQTLELLKKSKDIIYDIDWQGALQLTKTARNHIVSIFILPPSMEILKQRLLARNTESLKSFNHRFNEAKNEISKCDFYDYIIINENIEESLKNIRHIIEAERLRTSRQNIEELIENFK